MVLGINILYVDIYSLFDYKIIVVYKSAGIGIDILISWRDFSFVLPLQNPLSPVYPPVGLHIEEHAEEKEEYADGEYHKGETPPHKKRINLEQR